MADSDPGRGAVQERGNNARIAETPDRIGRESGGGRPHLAFGRAAYWDESAFYEFTAKEEDVLEAATNELEKMTLAAAQHVID